MLTIEEYAYRFSKPIHQTAEGAETLQNQNKPYNL